jgi:hypothetical protein
LATYHGPQDTKLDKEFIQLRKREDIESDRETPDLFEDDDYLAYDERLTQVVESLAEATNDPDAWRSLVDMRYNPDSQTGKWLASHCVVLPYVVALTKSRYDARRMIVIYVLAGLLKNCKGTGSVTPSRYKELKTVIRWHASHDSIPVSTSAIQGLGVTNDKEDASFLRELSEQIPDAFRKKLAITTAQQIEQAAGGGSL